MEEVITRKATLDGLCLQTSSALAEMIIQVGHVEPASDHDYKFSYSRLSQHVRKEQGTFEEMVSYAFI